MSNSIASLKWRYATKKFDTTKKLSAEQLQVLKDAIQLAPSSFGLQPWKAVIVSNPLIREQLKVAAWGQTQITDASHLVVFAVQTNLDAAYVDKFIATTATTRNVSAESLATQRDMMASFVTGKNAEWLKAWAARQAYLGLGTMLTVAAHEQIDACPMEGFDPTQFTTILGLDKVGLEVVVIAAVGFRSADDQYAAAAKVRFPQSDLIIEVK